MQGAGDRGMRNMPRNASGRRTQGPNKGPSDEDPAPFRRLPGVRAAGPARPGATREGAGRRRPRPPGGAGGAPASAHAGTGAQAALAPRPRPAPARTGPMPAGARAARVPARPTPTRPDPARPDPTRPGPARPGPTRPHSQSPSAAANSGHSQRLRSGAATTAPGPAGAAIVPRCSRARPRSGALGSAGAGARLASPRRRRARWHLRAAPRAAPAPPGRAPRRPRPAARS